MNYLMEFVLSNKELLLGMFTAFGGCSIRYGELYKRGKLHIKFYLVDSLTAIFIGAFMYLYLVTDLGVSPMHAVLFNILVGNLGSRIVTIGLRLNRGNIRVLLYNLLESANNRNTPKPK